MAKAPLGEIARRNPVDGRNGNRVFVIDRHRPAVDSASAFAHETSVNALLLIGGPAGVGKTELARWILSTVSAHGHRRTRVLSARDMASRIVEALRHNTRGEMSCRFGRGDCVAIEDGAIFAESRPLSWNSVA